jgi:hypothetical protein
MFAVDATRQQAWRLLLLTLLWFPFARRQTQHASEPIQTGNIIRSYCHDSALGTWWLNFGASIVDRLQYLLKIAFGTHAATRVPPEPNEFTVQRQRAFEETARKIETLRQARLLQRRDAAGNVH